MCVPLLFFDGFCTTVKAYISWRSRVSGFTWPACFLSYPHFGPKNTRSNFLSVSDYFKFTMSILQFSTVLQTHILLFPSLIFLHVKPSKMFSCITNHLKISKTIAYFPIFYSNFLHKIIQKGILVISYKGTHFSPYNLSLSLFNLSAWIINQILSKNRLSFAFESVWVVFVLRGILVFSHQTFFDIEVF